VHKPTIRPDVVRRANERRGRLWVFDSLSPERAARIVVDLQNGFMAPGQVVAIATAREIVPNVSRISIALRAAGGLTCTATQVCCESTACDAMMVNYSVFFIADGNAAFNDDEHNATQSAMAQAFCDVIDTDAMVGERVRAEAVIA
jgi:ureidoacrylate peracid hydrolase